MNARTVLHLALTIVPLAQPLMGLRRQVGQLFDYTYAIDRK